jgi:hypothetical protein
MQKSLDAKIANIHADPHGRRTSSSRTPRTPTWRPASPRRGRTRKRQGPLARRVPRPDARDHAAGARRHHADVGLDVRAAHDPRAAVRQHGRHARRPAPTTRPTSTCAPAARTPTRPSRPFQSTTIDHIQAGKLDPTPSERRLGANLGLYSITPNNNIDFDYVTINAYKEFRLEAERKGFRHFLEVFDPNACGETCPADLGRFINDLIVRTLAGVPSSGRPVFLKIAYHGPRAMEELVAYDPHLVPGILGGSSGTTHDAFKLLEEAKRYGARAALFGPEDQQQRAPAHVRHVPARDRQRAASARRRPCGRTTGSCRSWNSNPTGN